jgi:hypothetical protein
VPQAAALALLSAPPQRAPAHPALQYYRSVFARRVAAAFPTGARVLDLSASFDGLAGAGPWDGAHAGPGVIDGADLSALGAELAGCLRPQARVLLCVPNRVPLPALVRRALRAEGAWRRGHWAGDAQWALGPAFIWNGASALGVLVPGGGQRHWIAEHPQAFAVLAAVERTLRRWPLLRSLGEYTVIEGRRR